MKHESLRILVNALILKLGLKDWEVDLQPGKRSKPFPFHFLCMCIFFLRPPSGGAPLYLEVTNRYRGTKDSQGSLIATGSLGKVLTESASIAYSYARVSCVCVFPPVTLFLHACLCARVRVCVRACSCVCVFLFVFLFSFSF